MIIGEKVGMRARKNRKVPVNKKQCRWKHVENVGGIWFAGVTRKTAAIERGECPSFPAEKRPKNEVGTGRGGAICTTSRQKWAMAEYKTKGQGKSQ